VAGWIPPPVLPLVVVVVVVDVLHESTSSVLSNMNTKGPIWLLKVVF
jgi:hypothetical protein